MSGSQPTLGERVIPASRRPDGSLRKEVRVRAGYVPQDEVAVYQSKGSQFKGGSGPPPGAHPQDVSKQSSKSAKKNEKRKEKKKQEPEAATSSDQSKAVHPSEAKLAGKEGNPLEEKLAGISLDEGATDNGKRIRALRKKIRQAQDLLASGEALSAEQSSKVSKLDEWLQELSVLEQ